MLKLKELLSFSLVSAFAGGAMLLQWDTPVSKALSKPPPANHFFVSPAGSPRGDGSLDHPWDLATALEQPPEVIPGSVIWLRGGVYSGTFTSLLTGSPEHPIIVRQFPKERAIIDSGDLPGPVAFTARGSDTWYWGFEVMSSGRARVTAERGPDVQLNRASGINVFGPRTKFINLIVHDLAGGYGYWTPATDAEIYGNLIYYNGWLGGDRGHGHGIYAQNDSGTKWIVDNIQFAGFGMGIRSYGTKAAQARSFRIVGNVSFDSGMLAGPDKKWANFFFTVDSGADDIVLEQNYSYFPLQDDQGRSSLGWVYSPVEKSVTARGNYWIGGLIAIEVWNWNHVTFTDNVCYSHNGLMALLFHLPQQDISLYDWDHNRYYGSGRLRLGKKNTDWKGWKARSGLDQNSKFTPGAPDKVWTFIRPNFYEKGRANIIIYNWPKLSTVSVDVSKLLEPGARYEVRDAQNIFGPPVVEGVYRGDKIRIPMTGLVAARPIGAVPYVPQHTGPEFGVFVIMTIPEGPADLAQLVVRPDSPDSVPPRSNAPRMAE